MLKMDWKYLPVLLLTLLVVGMNAQAQVSSRGAGVWLGKARSARQLPPSLEKATQISFEGEASEDKFGGSVATTSHFVFDEDRSRWTIDLIIVGAYRNDAAGNNAGRVYLYQGYDSQTPALVLDGEAAGDQFGACVSNAGDVNGDGVSDIIIGARGNDAGGIDAGRAYLYFAGPLLDAVPDVIFDGEQLGDEFGHQVASVGDVNNDGYADVGVSARYSDAGGRDAGRVYVFFGGPAMDNVPDVIVTGEADDDQLAKLAKRPDGMDSDLNSDGFDDLVVATNLNDHAGESAGAIYVYYGGASMDSVPDTVLRGAGPGDNLGYSVSFVGGLRLAAGAPYSDDSGSDAGKVVLYAAPSFSVEATFYGENPGDFFGSAVGSATPSGNSIGAGIMVLIGAEGNDEAAPDAGKVYLYMDNNAPLTFRMAMLGENAGDHFGTSVCAGSAVAFLRYLGEYVEEVEYLDVLVGANGYDGIGIDAGILYAYRSAPLAYAGVWASGISR